LSANLLTVFKNTDLKVLGKTTANIVSLAFKTNHKTGAKFARAVLDNGTTLIKRITASGVVIEQAITLPEIVSVAQRNSVIKELSKDYTQDTIAAMLDISQATVSNVLRKK